MNDKQLQQLVEQLSLKHFQKRFQHRAYFNKRLRSTGGRYLLDSHNIEVNNKSYDMHGEQELIGIILHELCHYHLHIEGKGYMHKDRDFKLLLQQVGAPRHCQTIESKRQRTKIAYTYRCSDCFLQYKRYRKMNIKKYVCGKCNGSLMLVEMLQTAP